MILKLPVVCAVTHPFRYEQTRSNVAAPPPSPSSITLLHHPPPSPIHAHTSSHHPQVFPDYHKWAFDPPEPAPPERGQPLSPSHSNKPPFLSPQKYKNQFLKPVDNAAIWQQEVRLLLALRCIERPPLSL